jgi:hypothetical protein
MKTVLIIDDERNIPLQRVRKYVKIQLRSRDVLV